MRNLLLSACLLAGPAALAATMASQPWVTNRIAEAVAAIPAPDLTAYLRKDLQDTESQIFGGCLSGFGFNADTGFNDNGWLQYTAHNGNQLAQSLPDYIASNPWGFFIGNLEPATNYAAQALRMFAATGTITRALSYGTPNRWVDATGCVWEVSKQFGEWSVANISTGQIDDEFEWHLPSWETEADDSYILDVPGWYIWSSIFTPVLISRDFELTEYRYDWWNYGESESVFVTSIFSRSVTVSTNLVGRVALTNDIPDVSGYATPADVTAAIREQSLGGIYDSELGVWWTPHMANGAYYWTATTNVNLNAEGN